MDNVRFFTHFFFTPNRLVWKNWEKTNIINKRSGTLLRPRKTTSKVVLNLTRAVNFIFRVVGAVSFFTHFFFTPNRLVWKNWEKFNGAQDNPGDTTDYTIPQHTCKAVVGNLYDYFGGFTQSINSSVNGTSKR
jgi:hypothetical protein